MKMVWHLLFAVLVFPAWAQDWKVDYSRSDIRFIIKQMNVPVEGGFGRFNVQMVFEPSKPELGVFRVEVDVASIETGSEDGNGEVKRPAWFDMARYPKLSFVSKTIRREAPGRFTMIGDLAVKGRTRPLTVPLLLMPQRDGGWLASGRFALKRSYFDIGSGEWADPSVVANDIDGRFKMMLIP